MRYELYEITVQQAARMHGGTVEQLGGGHLGVKLTADGLNVMVALDLDDEDGWFCWIETASSERCCDSGYIQLGHQPLQSLGVAAYDAVLRHRCT